MKLEELLREARKVYENGGKAYDIYNLIIDLSGEKYPLAKYGMISYEPSFPAGILPIEIIKLQKEGRKQNELKYEETEELISNIEDLITEQYPEVDTERYNSMMHSKNTLIMEQKDFFMTFNYLPYKSEKEYITSEIKLYFNMPVEKTEEFFKEYTSFVIENDIFSSYKTRYGNATDMVTVRIKDVGKLDEVVSIINKYRNFDKTNPLVDTYDGIGYTLDNGESYNDLLSKLIYDYVSKNEEVDQKSFIKYLEDFKNTAKAPRFSDRKDDMQYIHSLNFTNLIENKEFDIEEFKNKYIELRELERNAREEKRFVNNYTAEIKRNLEEIGLADMDKMYSAIDSIINDNQKTVEFSGKTYKIIDILSLYYYGKNIKEELTYSVEFDIRYARDSSISKMKRDIEEYVSDIVVELVKIGYDSDEKLLQGISSVINNDKTIATINGKEVKLNDLIKYIMSDYIKEENTQEALYDATHKMISLTDSLCDCIDSKEGRKSSLQYKLEEKIECFEDENSEESLAALEVYDMAEKLLGYKYKVEKERITLSIILDTLDERARSENKEAIVKVKQQ